MDKLFGIPMNTILAVCLGGFAVVFGLVAYLALTNGIFFKLGVRKTVRRPGRTALVVIGLMLGTTIITAAFSTGDTMTHTIRSSVLTSLGHIDEVVSASGTGKQESVDQTSQSRATYFDQALFAKVRALATATGYVDGVAPVITEPIAVQDTTSKQNQPMLTLFAADPNDMAGFGEMTDSSGRTVSQKDLAIDEVFLNAKAADKLSAHVGDQLLVFAAGQTATAKVKAIIDYEGTGTEKEAMVARLDSAQAFLSKPGQINHIIISNSGGSTGGAGKTDAVIAALKPGLGQLGLEADPTKQDALKLAEEAGSVFTSSFVTFGSFSVVAGVMLIFLIFVMVSAERKPEMGIARAVGTQRGHLVQMFIFEGLAYDIVAAMFGAALGVVIAYGMVFVMARAFGNLGMEIRHNIQPRSLVVSYTLGVLLTFAVVTFSAWKVSVLNIVSAIRNLPEAETKGGGQNGLWLGLGLAALGALCTYGGLAAKSASPFWGGLSLIIIAFVPLLRRAGASDRIAYSVPGVLLTLMWLTPFGTFDFILPELSSDMSIFVVAGTLAVLGATWVVMYNSNLILDGLMAVFGRFRLMAPVVKTAVSRPLANRFRTGMAVAMFSLIVMTLVVMAVIMSSVWDSLGNVKTFGGGYDLQATSLRVNPIPDMKDAIAASDTLRPQDFAAVSNESVERFQLHQAGTSTEFKDYIVRGVDDEFLQNNTFDFALMAPGYNSPRDVWNALQANPDLAVIDAIPVPRKSNFNIQVGGPEFKMEGFYFEDKVFKPVQVEVKEPATGKIRTLTVIAVASDSVSPLVLGVTTSQQGQVAAFGQSVTPTLHLFKLAPGVNRKETSKKLESAFLMNGMDASVLEDDMNDIMGASKTFMYLLQGFMGLGLVVGVAALGVISARSVVERRQQIGVLRAIGFQKGMVELSFLTESSFVALLGIGVGWLLGMIIAFNVVTDMSSSGHADIRFVVPWLNLAIIFLVAYAVALLTTFLPARQASRIYPAEALRYE